MMERTLRIAGLAAGTLLSSGAAAQELLVNGGAESGSLNGWMLVDTTFPAGDTVFAAVTQSINGLPPRDGLFFFVHEDASTGSPRNSGVLSLMRQTLPALEAGTPLVLAGAIASHGPPSCDPGRIRLVFRDGGGRDIGGGADSGWIVSNDAWRSVQLGATIPSGAATMTVELLGRLDCGSVINTYFDSISLTRTGGCAAADLAPPYGVLDLSDINAFVDGFSAGNAIADLDANGVFDLGDVSLFIGSFVSGCP